MEEQVGKKVRGVGRLPEGQRRTGKGKRKTFALEGPRPSGGGGRGRPFLSLPATAQLGLRPGAAAAEAAMGVEGCTKCIKYLLFVFNFIFWVSPSAAGAVGLHVLLEPGFFHSFPPPPTNQPAPVLRFAPCYQGFGRRGAFILCYFFFFYAWQTQLYLFMYLFTRHVYIYSRRWIYFYVCGSSAQGRGFGSALLGSLSSPRTPHCPWVFRLLRAGWAEPPPVRRGRVKRGRLGPVLPLAAWSGPGGRAGRCLWELSGAGGCSQGAEVCFPEKVSRGIIRLPGYGGGSGSSCGGGRSPLASLPVFPQFWVRR